MNSKSHVNRKTDLPTRNRASAQDNDNIHNSSNAITIAKRGNGFSSECLGAQRERGLLLQREIEGERGL